MTYRKGERSASMNERDYPFVVEMELASGGFGNTLHSMHPFHREHGIRDYRGSRMRRDDREFMRWCFVDLSTAADFAANFGDVVLR